jgi:choline transport protein
MTILAWIATIATGGFLSATMIQGICLVNWPDYGLADKPYQGTLITFAVIGICVFFNTVIGSLLPKVEGAFLILHILGFFAILIPLVYYAPKGNASELFSEYLNEGGWPTYGLSFMVGTLGSAFSFAGADAAVHVGFTSPTYTSLLTSNLDVGGDCQCSRQRPSFNCYQRHH